MGMGMTCLDVSDLLAGGEKQVPRARKKALGMTSISPHAAIMANVSSTRTNHDKRFATRGKAGHST
jgi:hypothetical protein